MPRSKPMNFNKPQLFLAQHNSQLNKQRRKGHRTKAKDHTQKNTNRDTVGSCNNEHQCGTLWSLDSLTHPRHPHLGHEPLETPQVCTRNNVPIQTSMIYFDTTVIGTLRFIQKLWFTLGKGKVICGKRFLDVFFTDKWRHRIKGLTMVNHKEIFDRSKT